MNEKPFEVGGGVLRVDLHRCSDCGFAMFTMTLKGGLPKGWSFGKHHDGTLGRYCPTCAPNHNEDNERPEPERDSTRTLGLEKEIL